MAVRIRLKRMGSRHNPFYRLVVADARAPRDGRVIEEIGYYDPAAEPARVVINAPRAEEWLRRGARPTATARALLVRQGIISPGA